MLMYNVCAVPWGCSVPSGISRCMWGDILSTVGDVQYCGGYRDKCEYRGGYNECHGVILSTVGIS